MAHTPLYQKILDEAAEQRARGRALAKPTNGAATGIVALSYGR
jgi:hypothetical protein